MSNELHVEIDSEAESHTELEVSVRDHKLTVDEPENFGGKNKGPNPLEYMFTALAGCLNVTTHKVANEKDVEVKELEINVSGGVDLEGFENAESDKRPGFEGIEVDAVIETDADEETEKAILEEAEGRCPVSDNLQHSTHLTLEIN
ncbi:MAG: OsmC family protein [Candidatus Nanohaloarchaea archaeon]